jgi:hypothetical protein
MASEEDLSDKESALGNEASKRERVGNKKTKSGPKAGTRPGSRQENRRWGETKIGGAYLVGVFWLVESEERGLKSTRIQLSEVGEPSEEGRR